MAKLIVSKERQCIKDILSIFGCVRESTLEKYVDMINNTKFTSQYLINDVVTSTPMKRYSVMHTRFVKSSPIADTDYAAADAFEAYVTILRENPEQCNKESEVRVSKGRYPYNYVATFNNKTNLLMVFDRSGDRRLAHHNRSMQSESEDPNEVVVLVVPSGYKLEDLEGITLKGNYRIAMIRNNGPQNLICVISETVNGG